MNVQERKIIFLMDQDSRITTKSLGSKIQISQQSANYNLHKLENSPEFIRYKTHIDSAKFGLIKVIVFYNLLHLRKKDQIINALEKVDEITIIEECSQGFDLMVEFTTPNLSSFNKEHRKILHTFKNQLRQMEIYPIIVKHRYKRAYLTESQNTTDLITAGDRDLIELNNKEKTILREFQKNARTSIITLSKILECDPKTVISIKKKLEKKKIIQRYGISINTPRMSIDRSHVLVNINSDESEDINKFIEKIKTNPNIIEAQKILGNYEILLTIEKIDSKVAVMNKLREHFEITDFKIIRCENIIKEIDIPFIHLE